MRTLAMLAVLLVPSLAVAQVPGQAAWTEANWRNWQAAHPYLEVVRIESADTVLCQAYGVSDWNAKAFRPYVRVSGIPAEGLRARRLKGPPAAPLYPGGPSWWPGTILDVRNPSHVTIGAVPTLRY